MKEQLQLTETFNAEPSEIYKTWLDSKLHCAMTGGEAECSHDIGKAYSAWDGYITGKNLALTENKKIVQSWRTTEFEEKDEDSHLVIELNKVAKGTQVRITHTNIPEGQTQYERGWVEHYFAPMLEYFGE